ncbi:unnamed protein product [Moneuplotes crassus]|uniref:Uncharacterized protein n=1 Tax=Euplotes crassus TaxID=5936 RepID=A0AAD2D5R5_EUPCR|nr:unnamed protein product [Moneuplotes crassus]
MHPVINKVYKEDKNWTNSSFGCYETKPQNMLTKEDQDLLLIDINMMSKLRNLKLNSSCDGRKSKNKFRKKAHKSICNFHKIKGKKETKRIANCLGKYNGITSLEKLCDFLETGIHDPNETIEKHFGVTKVLQVSDTQSSSDEAPPKPANEDEIDTLLKLKDSILTELEF